MSTFSGFNNDQQLFNLGFWNEINIFSINYSVNLRIRFFSLSLIIPKFNYSMCVTSYLAIGNFLPILEFIELKKILKKEIINRLTIMEISVRNSPN